MVDLQEKVDVINKLVKTDLNNAFTTFIDLYMQCKDNNELDKLAQHQINLINSVSIDNVMIQFRALTLLKSLYEGINDYNFFKTKLFIGRLYSRINQFHKALIQYRNALNYFRSSNEYMRIVHCYTCTGLLYIKVEDFDESLEYFYDGLNVLKKYKEQIIKKNTEEKYILQLEVYYYNIALSNIHAKKYKEAEKYILQSIELTKDHKNLYKNIPAINLYIQLKIDINQKDGLEELIKDLLTTKGIKETRHYTFVLSNISDYYYSKGKYKKALKCIKKSIKYSKKFFTESSLHHHLIIDKALTLAFKTNDLNKVAKYSKKMQKIKKLQKKEKLYYSEISLKQVDEISDLELEKKHLEEISYVLGHDLKSPIRIAKNMAEKVAKEPEKYKEIIPKIINNSKKALEMIEATLNFSKLSLKASLFNKVSLTKVIQNIVSNLESTIQQKEARIVFEVLPTVYGNFSLLNQLFSNLISNALIYNKNKPVVEISHTSNNNYFIIEIKDNGIGIPQKELNKIFKMFKKSTNNNTEEGTGAGLAICDKIIAMHKGTIYAKSTLGLGTSFFIEIPTH